ncbi:uncharacterized protein LOC122529544 [Frieseomelitta varia]|uniref:uncharacterized protein LOC122529544 n=1 Tax=Frieseomelitta varia TaxID=561572 RepID=UPI001CB6B6C9|nr:uncharacterized protein LOC122529544 [Frieseomelitta varia]
MHEMKYGSLEFKRLLKTKNTKQFMFVKWISEVGDARFILEGDVVHWQACSKRINRKSQRSQHASIAEEICNDSTAHTSDQVSNANQFYGDSCQAMIILPTTTSSPIDTKLSTSINPKFPPLSISDLPKCFKIRPTIERKPPQIPPWTIKAFPTNTSLAELPKKILSPNDHRTRFLELNNNYSQHSKIYTDGSKTDTGVGYAITTEKAKKTQNLPTSSSIFTAETYAILEAIKYAHSNNEAQIVIYTDSMSVTKSLTKSYDQENQLISTIQELNHNQPNTNATVIWIPAHQGIKGNGKADAK